MPRQLAVEFGEFPVELVKISHGLSRTDDGWSLFERNLRHRRWAARCPVECPAIELGWGARQWRN